MTAANSKVIAPAMQSKHTKKRTLLSTSIFIERATAIHHGKYKYSKTIYVKSSAKLTITCLEHGDFEQTANDHLRGKGCRLCAREANANRQKYNQHKFIEKSIEVHGCIFEYSKAVYLDSKTPLILICKTHGEFTVTPARHLSRMQGCPQCTKEKTTVGTKKFIEKSIQKHGVGTYDYSKSECKNAESIVEIGCKKHGFFTQRAATHMAGHGCSDCGIEKRKPAQKMSLKIWLEKARKTHGDRFDYSRVEYLGSGEPVEIGCPDHGFFMQVATRHLKSKLACPSCVGLNISEVKKTNLDDWLDRAIKKHGKKYGYEKVKELKACDSKVTIFCRKHGDFIQRANLHVGGRGCQKCARENCLSGFSRSTYERLSKSHGGTSNLYLVECVDGDEKFYKLGIAIKGVKKRYYGLRMPYRLNTIFEIELKAALAWDMEKRLHNLLKEHKYQPKISFRGETECFSQIPNEVKRFLKNLEQTNQLQLIA